MYTGLGSGLLVDLWCAIPGNSGLNVCRASTPSNMPKPPVPPVPQGGYDTGTGPTVNQPVADVMAQIYTQNWNDWMAQNQRYMAQQADAANVTEEKPTDFLPMALLVGGVALLAFMRN